MRGKGKMAVQVNRETRITPAYAGKRWQRLPPRSEQQDHPRLCGEKSPLKSPLVARIGSPPPMRGKGRHGAAYAENGGITPAYAGKSCWGCISSWRTIGSPPPMRGKGFPETVLYPYRGITPAYAGKS